MPNKNKKHLKKLPQKIEQKNSLNREMLRKLRRGILVGETEAGLKDLDFEDYGRAMGVDGVEDYGGDDYGSDGDSSVRSSANPNTNPNVRSGTKSFKNNSSKSPKPKRNPNPNPNPNPSLIKGSPSPSGSGKILQKSSNPNPNARSSISPPKDIVQRCGSINNLTLIEGMIHIEDLKDKNTRPDFDADWRGESYGQRPITTYELRNSIKNKDKKDSKEDKDNKKDKEIHSIPNTSTGSYQIEKELKQLELWEKSQQELGVKKNTNKYSTKISAATAEQLDLILQKSRLGMPNPITLALALTL
jgi:hypothetical protein